MPTPDEGPWTRVAALAELVGERPFGFSSQGVELVLLRTPAGLRAYEGRCPHQAALLAEGSHDRGVLVCRNHGWRFDAETGRRLDGPERLQACALRVEAGSIWARWASAAPGPEPRPAIPACRRIEDLPGPRGLPILGNLLQMLPETLPRLLEDWAAAHGGAYQLRFGTRRALVVSDRTVADLALRARPELFRRFHTFESVAAELRMEGVFTAEGDAWRPLRKLAVEALSNRHLPGFYPVLRSVAGRLHRRWERAAAAGTIVDIAEEFRRFTVDVTTALALGRDVNTVEGKDDVIERHLGVIFPVFHERVMAPIPYWRLFRRPSDRRFERALSAVRTWLGEVIAQARVRLAAEPGRVPANFLEAMLCERDQAGQPFSEETLVGSALTMLIAGQDTTSTALAWTVHHLCENPRALAQLRAELDRVLGGAPLPDSVDQAQRLDYADAAVHEALRLSPIVPLLYLEANDDTVLGDIAVPKGASVLLLTRPSLRGGRFGVPEEFRPERWRDEERGALAHDPTAHIPFGSGPRLCPGRSLATLEARVALATLFGSFEVERGPGEVTARYAPLMVPTGLSVRLHARRRPPVSAVAAARAAAQSSSSP